MKKVVTIGGGSGSYVVLRGLAAYPLDITAVVSMFDSGGSTGVLRDEFGILPPGDVRRCLVALSDGEQAEILRNLFNYRFNGGTGLNGHSFGNLFLVALTSIYGSEIEAIKKASELLNLKGRVLPVSLDKADLIAVLEDGSKIVGETNIDVPKHDGTLEIQSLSLSAPAKIYSETDAAIREADLVILGPGDLFTSTIPNLLVEGMREALAASKAKKVFVCSLMTKWGETHGYSGADMAGELLTYAGIPKFDYVICNTATADEALVAAYAKENKHPVTCDDALHACAEHVIEGDFFSEADIARHDSEKLAKVLSTL